MIIRVVLMRNNRVRLMLVQNIWYLKFLYGGDVRYSWLVVKIIVSQWKNLTMVMHRMHRVRTGWNMSWMMYYWSRFR